MRPTTGSLAARADASMLSSRLCLLRRGDEAIEQGIAFARALQRSPPCCGEFVILPRRPLFSVGDRLLLPLRADHLVALQPAHGWVDGAARQAGHLHDAEAVDESGLDRLQDHRRGVGEFRIFRVGGHGALYLCSKLLDNDYIECYIGYVRSGEMEMEKLLCALVVLAVL